jgi:hypothetical protein
MMNPFIAFLITAARRTTGIFRLLKGEVRQEAQSAAKNKIGKQSIDGRFL